MVKSCRIVCVGNHDSPVLCHWLISCGDLAPALRRRKSATYIFAFLWTRVEREVNRVWEHLAVKDYDCGYFLELDRRLIGTRSEDINRKLDARNLRSQVVRLILESGL